MNSCKILLSFAALSLAAATASAVVLTFEDPPYTLGNDHRGSGEWSGGLGLTVVGDGVGSSQAIEYGPSSPGATTFASTSYDTSGLGTAFTDTSSGAQAFDLSVDIKLEATSDAGFPLNLRMYLNQGGGGIRLNLFENGRVQLADGTNVGNLVDGSFSTLTANINYDTGTYTVALDGGTPQGGSFTTASSYGAFQLQDGGTGNTADISNFTFDNLDIAAVPEPGVYAAVLGLLGLAYVVVRRRRS